MSVYLTDISLEESGNTICLNIFLPDEDNLPKFQLADIVIVKDVLLQAPRWDMCFSLLHRPRTRIHIYRAQPTAPSTLTYVPWLARPRYAYQKDAPNPPPTTVEKEYALYLHQKINKGALPDITTFEQTAAESLQRQDKRRELKDVCQGMYCDLLVQVVSEPHITDYPYAMLWVSDYTENSAFEDKGDAAVGGAVANGGNSNVGDSNGYLTKFGASADKAKARGNGNNKTGNDKVDSYLQWRGPPGRRSMFMVCFSPHAEFIQQKVKRGSWVTMKNVHIKYSEHGIEGVMASDISQGSPLRVALVATDGIDRENMDARFIAALLRKRDLEKGVKAEAKKRKALHDASNPDDGKALNSRGRRKLSRKGKHSKANEVVACEFNEQPVVPLALVLDPRHYVFDNKDEAADAAADTAAQTSSETSLPKACLQLPFANIKFKARVRVVDFLPHKLTNFAVRCRRDEYAILGGNEESSSSSSSEDDEDDEGGGERVWEWRFALLLEDASLPAGASTNNKENKASPARVWAVVNNFHGQALLKQDACDLHKDSKALGALREKLFLLWGNLQEKKLAAAKLAKDRTKAAHEAKQKQAKLDEAQQAAQEKAKNREEQARERVAVNKASLSQYPPPVHDDSEDDIDLDEASTAKSIEAQQKQKQQQQQQNKQKSAEQPEKPTHLSSRPFVCCLQQYGVLETVVDSDSNHSGSGEHDGRPKKVWRQTFGMFGTTIRG
ncbi:hypothetical protein SBRCBS47491_001128 [Sporothrix bragantina]|uniref:Protection of telomeres protein 1 ssDNA-binding domain-containing protein n=1 Tax=Sporothrix bragantina TaxID=671064 RepID=A0ABP0AVZ8_9PEZI